MFDIDFICLIAREKVDGGVCGFLSLQRPKLKAADLRPPKFWMIWITCRMMMDDDLSGPMAP
jgi:hypothetical protein